VKKVAFHQTLAIISRSMIRVYPDEYARLRREREADFFMSGNWF